MSEFEIIKYIGSPITLLAFIIVIIARAYSNRLKNKLEMFKSIPENERAAILDKEMESYHITPENDNLTKEQKFKLINTLILQRLQTLKFLYITIVILVILILSAFIIWTYVTKSFANQETEKKSNGNSIHIESNNKNNSGTINFFSPHKRSEDAKLKIIDAEIKSTSNDRSGLETTLDLKIMNVGDSNALITRIIVKQEGGIEACKPYLKPSAEYVMNLEDGEKIKHVTHEIYANRSERIVLHVFHSCLCCSSIKLSVALLYNKDQIEKSEYIIK